MQSAPFRHGELNDGCVDFTVLRETHCSALHASRISSQYGPAKPVLQKDYGSSLERRFSPADAFCRAETGQIVADASVRAADSVALCGALLAEAARVV